MIMSRAGSWSPFRAGLLRRAVAEKNNILVAGGTGSGKTTLTNALLAEPAFCQDRVVIIEDTRELQCAADDRIQLLTKRSTPEVTMTDLLRHTLRLRPDRIVIGEVRGRRSPRFAQGVEHRTSRWGGHLPRQQCP